MYLCLLFTFLASSLGVACLTMTHHFSEKMMSLLYGGAAGIMMAACFLSLLLPALQSKQLEVVPAFLLGVGMIFCVDHLLPHESALTHEIEGLPTSLHSCARLILTMTMHNIVQGLALGISFCAGNLQTTLMFGIGLVLQNIPEGAATALPLLNYFSHPKKAFWLAEALSFLEIPMCLFGYLFAGQLTSVIHPLFGFGAGILLYTIIEEIIPDAWSHQNRPLATLALFFGFAMMMFLYLCF